MKQLFKPGFLSVLQVLAVFLLLIPLDGSAQSMTVKGSVKDEAGKPISGATVTIVGSSKGVLTDEAGMFTIEVKSSDQLLVSYIGKESKTIAIEGKTELNVVLKEAPDELDEVTVVAFGQQKKESVVGSITTVKPGDLKVPSSNLTTALAGRVAGMIAFQQSGEPGADNADFFIRGVTSFGYSNRPLILVDGVEVPATELARLQVDDLASFSIMKDASATALYGARGANGVILITTKEGREGKANISLRYETSASQPTKNIELADPITYMKLANESSLTRGRNRQYLWEKIERTAEGADPMIYPATDWQSLMLKDRAFNNRLNLNVSGGGKVARYYVAATYNKDNGMLKVDQRNNFNNGIDLKTYGLRSNVNINLTKSTEAIVRLNTTWTDYTGPLGTAADFYKQIIRTDPVLFPAFYEPDEKNSTTEHILFGNSGSGNYLNPYANLMKGYRDYTNAMFLAQFEVKQDLDFIVKGLKASAMYNTTRYNYYQVSRMYSPFYYGILNYDKNTSKYTLLNLNPTEGKEYLSYSEDSKQITSEDYFQGILSYSTDIGEHHALSGMLVYNMQNKISANAGSLQNSLARRNLGLAGRFTYAFQSKYFLEGNFGYNGSERFASEHRFGFFPSVGAAWYVSREPFWKGELQHIVTNFKLRGTYGLVGNDAIGSLEDRFFYLSEVDPNISSAGYTFGSEFGNRINGVSEGRLENRAITWETSRKLNLSAEVGLFNLANLVVDVYKENRYNILMDRAHTPNTMGVVVLPQANVGKADSKGIDVSLEANKNYSSGWFISGRGNFTYAESKFVKYEEPDYTRFPWRSRIGLPIGQQFGFVAERLFVDDAEAYNSPEQFGEVLGGDIKYKDIDNDGVITDLDQVPIGYPTVPKMTYGFGLSLGYKGVDFSTFLQGSAKSSFWIDAAATAPFVSLASGQKNQLLQSYVDSHWAEDNRDLKALWPRFNDIASANNTKVSTWFMRNGNFLRIKQVEMGYTFKGSLSQKIGIEKIRMYVNGTNLYNFSKFKLWDVEMGGNGLGYPLQQVYNFGIQCSL
ncbi:SusC/RagA family TonB-linked outer membrane protein [Sphingobacterium faecale]|uniref:TonB-dependent receptor n=1 Tax=Sphingobacterium faecale TaxID=2803775 RepID=A0ABS1R3W9_9SPHI|nr:TonB-dependent receptor [Sphingobacterium faecale]MBL1409411.1 TonB-dependent receptor [Sphingobacterium faecale]